MKASNLCRCGSPCRSWGQRNCLRCHAEAQKRYRARHVPTAEERRRSISRAYAGVYLRRGKIPRLPCSVCGAQKAQMHHSDYSKPLAVTWLCCPCRLALKKGSPRNPV